MDMEWPPSIGQIQSQYAGVLCDLPFGVGHLDEVSVGVSHFLSIRVDQFNSVINNRTEELKSLALWTC